MGVVGGESREHNSPSEFLISDSKIGQIYIDSISITADRCQTFVNITIFQSGLYFCIYFAEKVLTYNSAHRFGDSIPSSKRDV